MSGKAQDLRVISGEFGGRRLASPNDGGTHPMGAREKLALFNLLADVLWSRSVVLDVFAGSGAVGIEALSRGAREVVFVEKNPKVAKVIRGNLDTLGVHYGREVGLPMGTDETRVRVFPESAEKFALRPEYQKHFNVIFADPPYDLIDRVNLPILKNLLAPDGMLIVSSPAAKPAPEIEGVKQILTRTYAGARITIYQ